MEKTEDAFVIPMDAGWNDIGSWSSLWDATEKDENGNAASGDVMLLDVKFVNRADDKLVALVGLDDMVVVSTKDATLVAGKTVFRIQKVVALKLKEADRHEWKLHREVHRPWGKYDSVDSDEAFQVKRITMYQGNS